MEGSSSGAATEVKKQADTQQIVKEILGELKKLPSQKESLDETLELARFSLETVTHLTEYEDEKANRILAAMAFLSAFAAIVFSVFAEKFHPGSLMELSLTRHYYTCACIGVVYLAFLVYCAQIVIGASLCNRAVRPRFFVPKSWSGSSSGSKPASFLFFQKILETGAKNWGSTFASLTPLELKREYTINCIVETYLIAEKIRVKLKPLQTGIGYFWWSTVTLLIFLIASTIALGFGQPVSPPPETTQQIAPSVKKAESASDSSTPAQIAPTNSRPAHPKPMRDQRKQEPHEK
jgi:hypothetical protein